MFLKNYKFEIIIGSALSLMSVYLFYQLMTIKPKGTGLVDKLSFEMIRPHKDLVNEFSLDGREVDSQFENPFVKKNPASKNEHKNNKPKLVPIKNKVAEKKTDKSKKTEKPKTGMNVRLVPRDETPLLMTEDSPNYNPSVSTQSNQTGKNTEPKDKKKSPEEEKKTKSISEFVDLLTDPKPERIGELVAALKNNEINMSEFYDFVGKMLKSERPNVQSVGVYLAYHTSTYEAFRIVATNQEILNPEVKAYSEQFFTSFTQPSKLSVIAQALQSNDIKVVIKAGEVIISGLQKIQNGQSIDYGARFNRGNNEVKSASVLGYFLPIAESLKTNQNQTIASLGAALSEQLSRFSATP